MQANMKDTHETNLPIEESGELEETKASATMPEGAPEETQVEESIVIEDATTSENVAIAPVTNDVPGRIVLVNNTKLTKEAILSKLTNLVNASVDTTRNDVELLKQAFYKIHKLEVDERKKAFIEGGGEEKDFQAPEDEIETKIKALLNDYKERKSTLYAKEEQRKAANYALKLQLINRIKELTESQEDFNKLYNEFKEIQQRWKEAKPVPQEHANELWKNYQVYSERFYDLIKINHQFRDYDFKKNMDFKTALCEIVEKLEHEPDVVSAFHQLQKLHQQWREIGPVAKEFRESLWARFKAASASINKRHQEHFEQLKFKEQDNLKAKIAFCEQIENIDYSLLKTIKNWDAKNAEVIAAQEKWKQIGFAPKKHNVKVFERFRSACNVYFSRKGDFFKNIKEGIDKNLELKKNLCEKAEALKNSTDWKETTEKLMAMQKEWKTIGPVPRRYSDAIWKQFISACDYFFEQKNKNVSSHKNPEHSNLAAKKELIGKINNVDTSLEHNEALNLIKEYMTQWNAIGFVPFKEKDKIYKEYHEAIDKQFDRLKVDQNDRRMQTYRSNLNDITSGEKGKGKLYGERDKLMRTYERMKSDLQTYENNIGFLSISSKGGGGLVKEMERKIEKLKEEMALIIKKIDAIDENLE
jgi:pterin-4a-carbinolamine dehydratase